MATFLHDIIRETSGAMGTTLVPLPSLTIEDINASLEENGDGAFPALLSRIPNEGTYRIQPNGKAFIEYRNVLFWFVDLAYDEQDGYDLRDQIEQVQAVAVQFFQRMAKNEAITKWVDFTTLQPTFQELVPDNSIDLDLPIAGVQATLASIVIDPSLTQNNCD